MEKMKILGFTESFNSCECCGRQNLKGTYIVEYSDGNIFHFGSTCVKYKDGFDNSRTLNEQINDYKIEVTVKARAEFRELGGYDLRSKLYTLEFLSDEYLRAENELNEIENKVRAKYINDYIKHISI